MQQADVPPLFSEPGWPMHTAAETGIDDAQASRSPDQRYRTTPLRGLFARSKGGFYHDGRFPDLGAVIDHYDRQRGLNLTPPEKSDLGRISKVAMTSANIKQGSIMPNPRSTAPIPGHPIHPMPIPFSDRVSGRHLRLRPDLLGDWERGMEHRLHQSSGRRALL
jgi:hypothetical protein